MQRQQPHRDELVVLALFGGGLIALLGGVLAGLFLAKATVGLPNWAENVLVAIATGALLKMGDVLSALVALSSGRREEGLSEKLATSTPVKKAPEDAGEAAQEVADEAQAAADEIQGA